VLEGVNVVIKNNLMRVHVVAFKDVSEDVLLIIETQVVPVSLVMNSDFQRAESTTIARATVVAGRARSASRVVPIVSSSRAAVVADLRVVVVAGEREITGKMFRL
jgi:hypothetical protein